MARDFAPLHPGVILLEEFLTPLGISQNQLARSMRVAPGRINEIVNGKRAITAETALRLSHALGTSAEFWLNLQMFYELELIGEEMRGAIDREVIPLVEVDA